MQVLVLGANGKAGSLIVKEALRQNLAVTAMVRDRKKINDSSLPVVEKDVFSLSYADLEPFAVIVVALGFWQNPKLHSTATAHLLKILQGKPNRIIFVGGAGSLFVNSAHNLHLVDSPDFPPEYKPVATAMNAAFQLIKKADAVNWTYLSPAPIFDAEAKATGTYKLGGDEVIVNSHGEPSVSYADYARALVDEIVKPLHKQQRFTVVSG